MSTLAELKARLMRDSEVRVAYEALTADDPVLERLRQELAIARSRPCTATVESAYAQALRSLAGVTRKCDEADDPRDT